ncbi:MAG: hypothetical protein DCC52_10655 [Chloroflexi bacterium]|nr:MAG: hypothetical protein DCC52_10655 [Chloroflexota bacterium]
MLNQLEAASPGAKLQFYVQFLKARSEGFFDAPPAVRAADDAPPDDAETFAELQARAAEKVDAPGL